jgi:Kef-type K+ transport system membrane component KefB
MPPLSLSGLAAVAAVAFLVPLLLASFPRLRLPALVLEILAGVVIGPSGLGWVRVDVPIQIFAVVGLSFILLLGGLEVGFDRLRGRLLNVAVVNFAISFALALLVAYALRGAGLVQSPFFIAVVLAATSLGVIVPVLKDAGQEASAFGQLVIASASIADFATIVLLSVFFSREAARAGARAVLLAGFVLLAAAVGLLIARAERSMHLEAILVRLQDTTAQIRVRGIFLLLAGFIALAQGLGLEVVFAAFTAGVILKLVDPDLMSSRSNVRPKLEAVGFGLFVPMFFVTSGLQFNLRALMSSPATIALVPVFFAALLVIRGLPAILYRSTLGTRGALAAGMLQATSLGFIVVAAQIGMELGLLTQGTGAALIAAGLLSVMILPLAAATTLRPAGAA